MRIFTEHRIENRLAAGNNGIPTNGESVKVYRLLPSCILPDVTKTQSRYWPLKGSIWNVTLQSGAARPVPGIFREQIWIWTDIAPIFRGNICGFSLLGWAKGRYPRRQYPDLKSEFWLYQVRAKLRRAVVSRFEIGKPDSDTPQAPILDCNGVGAYYQVCQYKPGMGQIEPLQRDSDR